MRSGHLLFKIYLGCFVCVMAAVGLPFAYYTTVRSARHQEMARMSEHFVSDLALRSSQYEKIFDDSGFDGLMDKLQKQIAADRAAC